MVLLMFAGALRSISARRMELADLFLKMVRNIGPMPGMAMTLLLKWGKTNQVCHTIIQKGCCC
jgi:hypothetical protein